LRTWLLRCVACEIRHTHARGKEGVSEGSRLSERGEPVERERGAG